MAPPLPLPRQFLTSLINSIAAIPPAAADESSITTTGPPNPLRNLPSSARPLLTTLHVVFPALLLPALDLLDRSLVTAVVPARDEADEAATPAFYLVRSAASSSRKTFSAFPAAAPYIVRLGAWNCSCASFAFEAFPAPGRRGSVMAGNAGLDGPEPDDDEAKEVEGEFGALSFDGRRAGGVPCCKHLLACLLAESWGAVLGSHVVTRMAGRDEMAGLVVGT